MPIYKIKERSLGIEQGFPKLLAQGEPSFFLCVHCRPPVRYGVAIMFHWQLASKREVRVQTGQMVTFLAVNASRHVPPQNGAALSPSGGTYPFLVRILEFIHGACFCAQESARRGHPPKTVQTSLGLGSVAPRS